MRALIVYIALLLVACGPQEEQAGPLGAIGVLHQSLQDRIEYARMCDEVIRTSNNVPITVPSFDCENGTRVPDPGIAGPGGGGRLDHLPHKNTCDFPNQLNRECDPGSKFTTLFDTPDGFVVAHCRKKKWIPYMDGMGNTRHNGDNMIEDDGRFSDIAVIQHSRINGATCFYQSPVDVSILPPENPANPGHYLVPAPSQDNGASPFWNAPNATTFCVNCHDSGPIIRSQYLAQLNGMVGNHVPDQLNFHDLTPNATNKAGAPYWFPGPDNAKNHVYAVRNDTAECTTCHRLGVDAREAPGSPFTRDGQGTALDFAMRSVGRLQDQTPPMIVPGGTTGPEFWMVPGLNTGDDWTPLHAAHVAGAVKIHSCAVAWQMGAAMLPAGCLPITEFTSPATLQNIAFPGANAMQPLCAAGMNNQFAGSLTFNTHNMTSPLAVRVSSCALDGLGVCVPATIVTRPIVDLTFANLTNNRGDLSPTGGMPIDFADDPMQTAEWKEKLWIDVIDSSERSATTSVTVWIHPKPAGQINVEFDQCSMNWRGKPVITGANQTVSYTIKRLNNGQQWTDIAANQAPGAVYWFDMTADRGQAYSYKLCSAGCDNSCTDEVEVSTPFLEPPPCI